MGSSQKYRRIVLVTGMSGAGRSSALKILEDAGYEAIDNLPLALLPALVDYTTSASSITSHHSFAIGIDVRAHDFDSGRLRDILDKLRLVTTIRTSLLYLECDNDVLLRRFTETRRRHPIGKQSLMNAIQEERQLISPLRSLADEVMDTSQTSPVAFANLIRQHFSLEDRPSLTLQITSFSYRLGVPREADMVFDARCLINPYYDERLRPLTGCDDPVIAYLSTDKIWSLLFPSLTAVVQSSLSGFRQAGRSYVTVACGCTGGQHRSVFMAEKLGHWLRNQGERVTLTHRDLPKGLLLVS